MAGMASTVTTRPARASDARVIRELVDPYVRRRILLGKELVTYFESIQEFQIAEIDGVPVGCGALHVMWDDLAEVRTLAVRKEYLGMGVGHRLLEDLLAQAEKLGVSRVFCLTFEKDFFEQHGFEEIEGTPVGVDVFQELLRSHDDGIAEFLDLARVKPNTLGNIRMLRVGGE